MLRIVVRDRRSFEHRDAASIWTAVADLSRFDEWFPVRDAISMTGTVPQVGNIIFVSVGRSRDPERAVRLEVTTWEAGRRFECEVRQVPGIDKGHLTVDVEGTPSDAAIVTLLFTGEADGIAGRISGYEIGRRFRRALDRLAS